MSAPVSPVIVTTPDELRAIVRAAVDEAMYSARRTPPAEWLDAVAVGAMFGVHARSVRKLRGLPSHRFGAKLLRYRRDEVLAWAESQGRRVQP